MKPKHRTPKSSHEVEMGFLNNQEHNHNIEEDEDEPEQFLMPKLTTKPHPAEVMDQVSRGLFPLGFILCNFVYWSYYLYFTDQDYAELHGMRSQGLRSF